MKIEMNSSMFNERRVVAQLAALLRDGRSWTMMVCMMGMVTVVWGIWWSGTWRMGVGEGKEHGIGDAWTMITEWDDDSGYQLLVEPPGDQPPGLKDSPVPEPMSG